MNETIIRLAKNQDIYLIKGIADAHRDDVCVTANDLLRREMTSRCPNAFGRTARDGIDPRPRYMQK